MSTKTKKEPKGRQITLDPIKIHPITFELHEVESTIPCGFRMGWMEGEHEGKKFDLSSGAGCGSPYFMFTYDGRDFCADMRDVIPLMLAKVSAE